jgi:RNA polymerase sigma-70 factor (ECF subfamily)
MPHQTLTNERTALTADTDLVDRARARDESAIRAIIKANNQRLYRLARGILRDDAEAEDVVQETYIRLFTHLEDFRGASSLTTWLSRIAINEALGRLRKRKAVLLADASAQVSAQIIRARSTSCQTHSDWFSSRG